MSWQDKYKSLDEFLELEVAPNLISCARRSRSLDEVVEKLRQLCPHMPAVVPPNTLRRWTAVLREKGYTIPNLRRLYGTTEEGAPEPVPARHQLDEHKWRNQIRTLRQEKRDLLQRTAELEHMLEYKSAVEQMDWTPLSFSANRKSTKSPLTVCAAASDWHVGERVDPATINGLNSYDPDIAEKRAERFFQRTAFVTRVLSHGYDVDRMVIGILGDMITGTIHPDLAEVNDLGPFGESELFMDLAESGIRLLCEEFPGMPIHIVTADGNHGRITSKMRSSTRLKYSLEAFLYRQLQRRMSDLDNVTWQINSGLLSYVDIYGYVFRWLHGDPINFKGGIGGLTIPLYKAIDQWDKERRAHWTVLGHHHSQEFPKHAIVNGSLMGYTPYAQEKRCGYEPAAQSLWGVHPKVGRCHMSPIVVS